MFFKRPLAKLPLVSAFAILLLACANNTFAQGKIEPSQTALLDIKPNKCVALNEGRSCYANVSITWQLNKEQSYCLVTVNSLNEVDELGCWQSSKVGRLNIDLELTRSIDVKLVTLDDKKTLAKTVFQVSWLYESSPRKRRWRLF